MNDSQQVDYLERDEDLDINYLLFSRNEKIKQGTNEAWAFKPNMLSLDKVSKFITKFDKFITHMKMEKIYFKVYQKEVI